MSIRMNFSPVFLKIMLLFLAVISPIYLLSVLVNFWGANDVKNQILVAENAKLSFFTKLLDSELSDVMKMQKNIVNDRNLEALSTLENMKFDWNKHLLYQDIQNKLKDVRENSDLIEEVSVYIPNLNKKISDILIEDIDVDSFLVLKNNINEQNATYPFVIWNGSYYLALESVNRIQINGKKEPAFIIGIKISSAFLKQMLEKSITAKDSGVVLIGKIYDMQITGKKDEAIIHGIKAYLEEAKTNSVEGKIQERKIGNVRYLISYNAITLLGSYAVTYVKEEYLLSTLQRYAGLIWLISIITVTLVMCFSYAINRIISRPLKKLMSAFGEIREGKFDLAVQYSSNDEFRYIYEGYNEMIMQLKTLIEQVYEQKILTQTAELKQLQYQINPHFLYNSMFNIYWIASRGDSQKVMQLSSDLGKYYEYITRGTLDEVNVHKEIEHAKTYIQIQTVRFQDRIKVDFIDITNDYDNLVVPKLFIQPIIENAYKHGLENRESGGQLRIEVSPEQQFIYVTVEDNGTEVDNAKVNMLNDLFSATEKTTETTGLLNVHRRLQICYGNEYGLRVFKSELGGLKVVAKIPIKTVN